MIGTLGARTLGDIPRTQTAVGWPLALLVTIASPVLLNFAFPNFNLGLFAFIALAPLFLLWSKASWKQAFWWGWLAGALMLLLLWHWMTHSIGDFIGSWSIVALVLLCSVEALVVAVAAVLCSLVGRGEFRTISIFAAPAAWLLLEWWRTHGMLGVPFGQLGHVAAHLPLLLPLAAYGGVYLLTAIIALANASIAGIIGGSGRTRSVGALVLALLALLVVFGNSARSRVTFDQPNLRVAIAQGNISQREKWSPSIFEHTLATYADLTRQARSRGARLVVWPETAVTSYPLQDPTLLKGLEALAAQNNVWILAGTVDRPEANSYYNAMLDLTPDGAVAGVYHKRFLVPFAEYLPLDRFLRAIPLMDNASHFARGPGPHLLSAAGYQWGTLICYESAFVPYAQQTANAGADAIIVATDDAWFGGTTGPYQHADMAVIDAVSTGRWIVRGADTGISSITDPKGNIIASLPIDQQGILIGDIGRGFETPYERYGIVWLFVLAIFALVAGLVRRKDIVAGWRSKRGRY